MLSKLPPDYIPHEVSYALYPGVWLSLGSAVLSASWDSTLRSLPLFIFLLHFQLLPLTLWSSLYYLSQPSCKLWSAFFWRPFFISFLSHFLFQFFFYTFVLSLDSSLWIPRNLNLLGWNLFPPSLTKACSIHPLNVLQVFLSCFLLFIF